MAKRKTKKIEDIESYKIMIKRKTKEIEDIEPEESPDIYSPTSWGKDPFETQEDYADRINDQEDLLDYLNK